VLTLWLWEKNHLVFSITNNLYIKYTAGDIVSIESYKEVSRYQC